jgi:hypothetical protein
MKRLGGSDAQGLNQRAGTNATNATVNVLTNDLMFMRACTCRPDAIFLHGDHVL